MRAVLARIVASSMVAGAALLASQCASDSDRNPEGGNAVPSRSDESAGPQGHRTDAGAHSMKDQAK